MKFRPKLVSRKRINKYLKPPSLDMTFAQDVNIKDCLQQRNFKIFYDGEESVEKAIKRFTAFH